MNFGTKGCMYCEGKCTKECIIEEKSLKKEMEQIKCYCGHTTYCDCGPLEEKSAVEWFANRIKSDKIFNFENIKNQAIEMENERVSKAFDAGLQNGLN